MNILITGASGFLGRNLIKQLNFEGNKIVALNRKKINNYNLTDTNVVKKISDYSCKELNSLLNDIDVVIHLAAKRGVGICKNDNDFSENIIITKNILDACVINNIKNLIYVSSSAVYFGCEELPWKENIKNLKATSEYGKSKIECEKICLEYAKKHDISIKILRLSQVLGNDEVKGHMMNTFIDNAFNKQKLIVKGKSVSKRDFVYIKDVIKAIEIAINYKKTDVFNIGSYIGYANYEIATMVNKVFDNIGNIEYLSDSDENMRDLLIDGTKAMKVLKFIPSYSLEQALFEIKNEKERETECMLK